MEKILVVCVGNICRSVLGERILRAQLPARFTVESAGIGALAGHGADTDAGAVAAEHGVSLDGHVARQFTREIGQGFDLILALEPGHKRVIGNEAPELSGKVMLLDQWVGAKGIADPYKKDHAFHERVFNEVSEAAAQWVRRLDPGATRV